jgi:hypothetical protein
MKVYRLFDTDWVLAEDPEDALAAWGEHMGEDPASYLDEGEVPEEVDESTAIRVNYEYSGDVPASLRDDVEENQDGEMLSIMLTAREWVIHERRGLLCSSEW